jgi:hypothetical protein
MTALTKLPSLGDVLKYEVNPNYTRDVITLLAGMPYPVGSVLGKITASGKYKLATSGGTDGFCADADKLVHDRCAVACGLWQIIRCLGLQGHSLGTRSL